MTRPSAVSLITPSSASRQRRSRPRGRSLPRSGLGSPASWSRYRGGRGFRDRANGANLAFFPASALLHLCSVLFRFLFQSIVIHVFVIPSFPVSILNALNYNLLLQILNFTASDSIRLYYCCIEFRSGRHLFNSIPIGQSLSKKATRINSCLPSSIDSNPCPEENHAAFYPSICDSPIFFRAGPNERQRVQNPPRVFRHRRPTHHD